jgi:DNA-binding XRE family transcriptional regulator
MAEQLSEIGAAISRCGEGLTWLRTKRQMGQEACADTINVPLNTWQSYEAGAAWPSSMIEMVICRFFTAPENFFRRLLVGASYEEALLGTPLAQKSAPLTAKEKEEAKQVVLQEMQELQIDLRVMLESLKRVDTIDDALPALLEYRSHIRWGQAKTAILLQKVLGMGEQSDSSLYLMVDKVQKKMLRDEMGIADEKGESLNT